MLTGKQKRYLRALANRIDPIIQVGKGGVGANLLQQVDEALDARELIKVRVLPQSPSVVEEVAHLLGEKTGSEVVQVIGNNMVLYRQGKEPEIVLP